MAIGSVTETAVWDAIERHPWRWVLFAVLVAGVVFNIGLWVVQAIEALTTPFSLNYGEGGAV